MARNIWVRTLLLLLALALLAPCFAAADQTAQDGGLGLPVEEEDLAETEAQAGKEDDSVVTGDPLVGIGGENVAMSDSESQDWYDEMYARMSRYTAPQGTVENGALRVSGHETLSPIEVEVLLAMEGAQVSVEDLISSDGCMNILLVGIDARPGETIGRSDSMILVSVELETAHIRMISFMRDLYVQIPGIGPNRLNAAYVKGGFDLLAATLASNFGVTCDHYVAVDFSVLGSLIDQLGGLEIDVEDSYFVDRINAVIENDNKVLGINKDDGKLKSPGVQILTGKQAQAYARFRYGARSGGDFGRTGRQREVIMKIFEKIQGMSVLQLAELATQNISSVKTDLALVDLIRLVPTVLQLKDATFSELRVPADGTFSNQTIYGMAVLVPDSNRIVRQIREFLEE